LGFGRGGNKYRCNILTDLGVDWGIILKWILEDGKERGRSILLGEGQNLSTFFFGAEGQIRRRAWSSVTGELQAERGAK